MPQARANFHGARGILAPVGSDPMPQGISLSLLMEPHEISSVPGLPEHVYRAVGTEADKPVQNDVGGVHDLPSFVSTSRSPVQPAKSRSAPETAGSAEPSKGQAEDTNVEHIVVRGSKFDDPDITNRFAPVIAVTGLWPHDVAQQAKAMPFGGPGSEGTLYDRVRHQGDWDVKNLKKVKEAVRDGTLSGPLAEEYGNFLYGVAMKGNGKSLPLALTGAGGYQTLRQGHGLNPSLETKADGVLGTVSGLILSGLDKMGHVMPGQDYSSTMSKMTDNGFQWGDNPGDSKKIQNGWLYAQGRHY